MSVFSSGKYYILVWHFENVAIEQKVLLSLFMLQSLTPLTLPVFSWSTTVNDKFAYSVPSSTKLYIDCLQEITSS